MAYPGRARTIKLSLALLGILGLAVGAMLVAGKIHADANSARSAQAPDQAMLFTSDTELDAQFSLCGTAIYYTSYPAKCRSVDGRLIQINSYPIVEEVVDEGH